MATSPVRLPTSNVAGNNQTSPGVGASAARAPIVPFSARAEGNGTMNPFMSSPMGSPSAAPSSGTSTGSLYDPSTSPGYNGQSNIGKQFTDMYGKGVGGMLDNLLKGMSGDDSTIFQQWLASMKPVEASERAGLQGTLASEGVSGNSSVSAIANSNLTSQFNAQAAGVDSQLMQQQLQDTQNILMGTKGDAAKEVATSGWSVFGDVLEAGLGVGETVLGGMTGNPALMGAGIATTAGGISGATGYSGNGAGGGGGDSVARGIFGGGGGGGSTNGMNISNPSTGTSAPQLPGFNDPSVAPGSNFSTDWLNSSQVDSSIFDSSPTDVQFEF